MRRLGLGTFVGGCLRAINTFFRRSYRISSPPSPFCRPSCARQSVNHFHPSETKCLTPQFFLTQCLPARCGRCRGRLVRRSLGEGRRGPIGPRRGKEGHRLLFRLLLALTLPRAAVTDRAAKSSSCTREKVASALFLPFSSFSSEGPTGQAVSPAEKIPSSPKSS